MPGELRVSRTGSQNVMVFLARGDLYGMNLL